MGDINKQGARGVFRRIGSRLVVAVPIFLVVSRCFTPQVIDIDREADHDATDDDSWYRADDIGQEEGKYQQGCQYVEHLAGIEEIFHATSGMISGRGRAVHVLLVPEIQSPLALSC